MSRTFRHREQAKNKITGVWGYKWDFEPRRFVREMNEKRIKLKTKVQDVNDIMDAHNIEYNYS